MLTAKALRISLRERSLSSFLFNLPLERVVQKIYDHIKMIWMILSALCREKTLIASFGTEGKKFYPLISEVCPQGIGVSCFLKQTIRNYSLIIDSLVGSSAPQIGLKLHFVVLHRCVCANPLLSSLCSKNLPLKRRCKIIATLPIVICSQASPHADPAFLALS
jgi:hypothetical protein